MTSRNNDQGTRPAQSGSEGAANGGISRSGNGRRQADQGDLWSDAPATRPQPPREAPSESRTRPAETNVPLRDRSESSPATERAPANGTQGTAAPQQREVRSATRPSAASTTRPVTRRVEPPPPPVIEEPAYEYEDDEDVYYEEPASMLRNPYVLAGLAVAVAIVLAVMVVFVFGKGGDSANNTANTGASGGSGAAAVNATAQSTVPPVTGLQVKSLTTATVHSGPGLDFLDLGLLRSNQDVQVVGRNDDASWYEIIFPPGSNFGGWVVASALKLPSDASSKVAVAQPTPVPRPSVPATSTPVPATATPEGNVDIALTMAGTCQANQPVVATISNTGEVALKDVSLRIVVTQNGSTLYDATYQIQSLLPGQSVPPDIQTNAVPPSVTVTATLVGLTEKNTDNNSASCTVGGSTTGSSGNNSVPPPVSTKTSATATPRSR